jgi:hypothetical protein
MMKKSESDSCLIPPRQSAADAMMKPRPPRTVTKSIGLGHMLFDLRNDRNQPADLDRYFNCFHESSFLSANEAVPTEI